MKEIDSKKLLGLMLERGLDVGEVAKEAGVSPTLLSVVLRHQRQCRFSTIHKLAKFFGVAPHELILENENKE